MSFVDLQKSLFVFSEAVQMLQFLFLILSGVPHLTTAVGQPLSPFLL